MLFFESWDFFKKLFNLWNLSCQILWLFHHFSGFNLSPPIPVLQHLFSPLSLPNSLFKTELNLSLKERKISSPFKARKSSCHAGKKHVDLTGRLSDKASSDRKAAAGGVSSGDIKCTRTATERGKKRYAIMIDYKIPKR